MRVLFLWAILIGLPFHSGFTRSDKANELAQAIKDQTTIDFWKIHRSDYNDPNKTIRALEELQKEIDEGRYDDVYFPSHIKWFFTSSDRYSLGESDATGYFIIKTKSRRSLVNFLDDLDLPKKGTLAHEVFLRRELAVKQLILEKLATIKRKWGINAVEDKFGCFDEEWITEENYEQTTTMSVRMITLRRGITSTRESTRRRSWQSITISGTRETISIRLTAKSKAE
jgi:hypothetical protein